MSENPAIKRFVRDVAPVLGTRLRQDEAARSAASGDASHVARGLPDAVVQVASTAEVVAVVQAAGAHRVALVPRGAGTGKAGGCIPKAGEIVIDLSLMDRILSVAPQDLYAVVQPGVKTADLDRAAQAHGLMYPPDPASWETSSIGGNIATNAGGPRALKYGVTRRYVWGLEVVLASGEVLRVGRKSIKGVAGYEMAGLFVGSEGTLGIITEATMHLVPAPAFVQTAWLCCPSVHAASAAADRMLTVGVMPRMLELIDAPALSAIAPKVQWAMPQGGAALLVETDGSTQAQAHAEMVHLLDVSGFGKTAIVATDAAMACAMRDGRRGVSGALKDAYPWKVSDDIAMPRSQMTALLDKAASLAAQSGLLAATYGHLGDGNLHINLLCKTADERTLTPPIRASLYRFANAHGGTISGEHGIGLSKRTALPFEMGVVAMAVQARLKACLDPGNMLNPGKVMQTATPKVRPC